MIDHDHGLELLRRLEYAAAVKGNCETSLAKATPRFFASKPARELQRLAIKVGLIP